MIVPFLLLWRLTKREPIKDLLTQKETLLILSWSKDGSPCCFYALLEFGSLPTKHQLVEFRHRTGVLLDLYFGPRVQDS